MKNSLQDLHLQGLIKAHKTGCELLESMPSKDSLVGDDLLLVENLEQELKDLSYKVLCRYKENYVE